MPRKNEPRKMIRVRLETRDADGDVVEFRNRAISDEAASDIIYHTIELVKARRRGAEADVVEYAEDELVDALESYDLIEED